MVSTHRLVAVLILCLIAAGCRQTLMGIRESGQEYADDKGTAPNKLIAELDSRSRPASYSLKVEGKKPYASDVVLLSFVQVSDVQLRDWGIYYNSRLLERFTDRFVPGIVRAKELDTRDELPLLALVEAINATVAAQDGEGVIPRAERPSFVVHTGDAVDSGTNGELFQFLNVMNRLKIPWINVVGNHDVFVMGNFPQRHLKTTDYEPSLRFVTSRTDFLRFHNAEQISGEFYGGGVDPRIRCHVPTVAGTLVFPGQALHGFADYTRAYYSLRLNRGLPLPFRILILDTVAQDKDTFFKPAYKAYFPWSEGIMMPGPGAFVRQMGEDQFLWLDTQLTSQYADPKELVLVFGHHPLINKTPEGALTYEGVGGGKPKQVEDYLSANGRVLGYFAGHTHEAAVIARDRAGRTAKFVEVTAPSLHEYPQFGFLVNVLWRPSTEEVIISTRPVRGDAEGKADVVDGLRIACKSALDDKVRASGVGKAAFDCAGLNGPLGEEYEPIVVATGVKCDKCLHPSSVSPKTALLVLESSATAYDPRPGTNNVEQLRELFLSRDDWDTKVVAIPDGCKGTESLLERYRETPPDVIVLHRGAFDQCGHEEKAGEVLAQITAKARNPVPIIVFSRFGRHPAEISKVVDDIRTPTIKAGGRNATFYGLPLVGDEKVAHFGNPCTQAALLQKVEEVLAGRH